MGETCLLLRSKAAVPRSALREVGESRPSGGGLISCQAGKSPRIGASTGAEPLGELGDCRIALRDTFHRRGGRLPSATVCSVDLLSRSTRITKMVGRGRSNGR